MLEVQGRQRRRITNQLPAVEASPPRRVIGILTPGSFLSMPPPIAYVMDTLRSKLSAAGYAVRFHAAPGCYTSAPARGLRQFIAAHPASAWLVLSAEEAMQRWLKSQNLPCLILGSSMSAYPQWIQISMRHADTLARCFGGKGIDESRSCCRIVTSGATSRARRGSVRRSARCPERL
jgi:hypothetical protein